MSFHDRYFYGTKGGEASVLMQDIDLVKSDLGEQSQLKIE